MQKSDGTRIDILLKALNISQLDFANTLGVTSGAVGNWKKRELGLNVINKIVKTYPQVRFEWLVTGVGEPLISTQAVADAFKQTDDEKYDNELEKISQMTYHPKRVNSSKDERTNKIPLIPLNAMAGSFGGDSITIMPSDIESYFIIPAFRKSDFAIRVEGDSMEPRYYRGDIIACTRVPLTSLWFQWHSIYVIDTRQGVLVKHVEKGSDDDHIMLVSENPDYKPFEIPTSEIFGLAIVNGVIRVE